MPKKEKRYRPRNAELRDERRDAERGGARGERAELERRRGEQRARESRGGRRDRRQEALVEALARSYEAPLPPQRSIGQARAPELDPRQRRRAVPGRSAGAGRAPGSPGVDPALLERMRWARAWERMGPGPDRHGFYPEDHPGHPRYRAAPLPELPPVRPVPVLQRRPPAHPWEDEEEEVMLP